MNTESEPTEPSAGSEAEAQGKKARAKKGHGKKPSETTERTATLEHISAFEKAREAFLKKYDGVKSAGSAFKGILSKESVNRIKRKDYIWNDYGKRLRNKLIELMDKQDTALTSAYSAVSVLMLQNEESKNDILRNFQGEYRYFRFASQSGLSEQAEYSAGKIVIRKSDGEEPIFELWSHDDPEKWTGEPEINGFVFKDDSQLFLLGYRTGVLRLAVARVNAKGTKSQHLMGVVLSVRMIMNDPFSARFLLVNIESRALLEKYGDMGLAPNGKKVGENAFLEYWKDSNNYMLLSVRSEDVRNLGVL